MKKIYMLGASALLSLGLSAQVVEYSASNLADFAAGVIVDVDGDGNNWMIVDLLDVDGNGTPLGTSYDNQGDVLFSESYDGVENAPLTPDNWWVSPSIDLSNASNGITLSLGRASFSVDYPAENYSVYMGSGSDAQTAIANMMANGPIYSETIAVGEEWLVRTADASAFAGESNVYIAVRHHDCTDELFLFVDDITLNSGTASVSANVLDVTSFPNPAVNDLTIKAAENMNAIQVIGMDGRIVLNQELNGTVATINVADLKSGVYYYVVSTLDGKAARKSFVKQ